ncbi:major facilitator superfamily MFS_1 [Pseudonocardia dioxanivorans CB1190]|uniref:Major facilitator superfamily MFS_1 n=1 Tax=Pseudonocardia dioxanivorans (strain ATCC 55486 / DSM 44775 / JCM 13855 / CB1190) TaxID=675635 RepID=F4CY55_PSEUX|nr:major facilitator superfamily MFS_1 [Pseudonocardia dioxanivorans CB1190]
MTAARSVRPNAIVAVLAYAGIVVALMQTVIIPLVPQLPGLLHASTSDAAWAITATLLAAAVATPTIGRLGDMYGKRRMLLVSLVVLVAGSVVTALADSLLPAIIGRTLQGLSSAVIPLGISIMRDELPPRRLGSAVAMMSASLGVGGALGLPAAAIIAEHADWHVLFWVSAGLGAVALALVVVLVPESSVRGGGRFDGVGAAGLSIALVALLLAISKGADWGWASGATLGLFATAVVVLVLWGLYELRRSSPLVDLRTLARRQILLTNLASTVIGFAMFAMSLVLPQLMQLPTATGFGLGRSMLDVGLVMAPSGLVMMAMAPVSARTSRTHGPKVTLMLAAVVVAIGYVLMILFMSQLWHFVLASVVIGAGIGLGYGAMPALIMSAVEPTETAAANSLNTLMRSIGTSVSSAVAGVVLAHMVAPLGPVLLPTQNGFRVVLALGAGAAVVALVVAFFIPGRRAAATAPAPAPAPAPVPVDVAALAGPAAEGAAPGGRTVRGRIHATAAGTVTVTAHGGDGTVLASTHAGPDGRYRLDGLPDGPVTLVVAQLPAVHEVVTVRAGLTRHDVALPAPAAPLADPAAAGAGEAR